MSPKRTTNDAALVSAFRDADDAWERGDLARRLHDGGRWRGVPNADGTPYPSWAAFCEGELGVTRVHANDLRRIAEAFDREQVAEHGHSRLKYAAKLTGKDRRRVLRAIERGESKREVERLCRDLKRGSKPIPPSRVADELPVPYDRLFDELRRLAGATDGNDAAIKEQWREAIEDAVRDATRAAVTRLRRKRRTR
ncbi:MAG: hypothetical protein R3B72_05870 [Polyangiaceae bacterium]